MKLTMRNTMEITVSARRNFHFNRREKTFMENCNIQDVKCHQKGARGYESSGKKILLPGGNFKEDSMKDEVVGLRNK